MQFQWGSMVHACYPKKLSKNHPYTPYSCNSPIIAVAMAVAITYISEGCPYFFLSVIRQGLAVKGRKNNFSCEKAQTNAYGLYDSITTFLNRIPVLKNVL